MPKDNDMQMQDYMAFTEKVAAVGASIALTYFRREMTVYNKDIANFDPVTEADLKAETAMREMINKMYPCHSIIGEEYGMANGGSPCWVLDPIDGTRAFITGSPLWGVLVAFNEIDSPNVSVISMPALNERFICSEGRAFWYRDGNNFLLRTRPCSTIGDAIAATNSPAQFVSAYEKEAFRKLGERVRMLRFGGDCYNYGLLAAGFLDVVVEAGLKPVDVHALIPVIEGAGGVITNWDGKNAKDGGQIIASGSAVLHERMLNLLNGF